MSKMNVSVEEKGVKAEVVNFMVVYVHSSVFIRSILSITYVWTVL